MSTKHRLVEENVEDQYLADTISLLMLLDSAMGVFSELPESERKAVRWGHERRLWNAVRGHL